MSGYDNPEAWVRAVAYRLCLNRWRKARNRVAGLLDEDAPEEYAPA